MELGNVLFGHSRGEYPVERFTAIMEPLLEIVRSVAPDRDECSLGYGVEFENDVFEMHPYCWCGEEDCKQCGTMEQVNFRFKPDDVEITWYKYMLRDAYSNAQITPEIMRAIADKCLESLQE